jgi:hypothetical protein
VRTVVVEDRGTFGPTLKGQLADRGVEVRWLPHPSAETVTAPQWANVDLVMLDAVDLSSQQDDARRSRLASLDILERITEVPDAVRPRVVVYSTHMTAPEVNIPLRQVPGADAFYELGDLWNHLDEVLAGDHAHQAPPPTKGDWARLHAKLTPDVDVAAVHQLMRRNERAWEQVWQAKAPFDRAAQVWIQRNVVVRLGPGVRSYRTAVDVTRKVAGLPRREP